MPDHCPACRSDDLLDFFDAPAIPVHSVTLMRTRAAARAAPTGDLVLALCRRCGFIFNRAFDPRRMDYSSGYEATQGFSSTFNAFHQRLADDLIDRFDLHGKRLLEIGCGNGEFLALLCTRGDNEGIGFDPIHDPTRHPGDGRVTIVPDFYGERYADVPADFVCCKMTLEHVADVAGFLTMLRRSLRDRSATTVFFQIPEVTRILKELAFWDFYYEHCSYFSPGSLARLFRRSGFEVLNLWTAYGDQYLMIEARPAATPPTSVAPIEATPGAMIDRVDAFVAGVRERLAAWDAALDDFRARGARVVLWGSGSKAVAFLTKLRASEAVSALVDVNPHKHGTFSPGTGHEILAPGSLRHAPPDVVVVMNPIYHDEIARDLAAMGLAPEILDVLSF